MTRLLWGMWLIVAATAPASAGARDYFTEFEKDFGTSPRGPVLTHYFIVKNTTNQNITLMGKRPEYPGTITWAVDRFGSFLDALDGRPATVVTFSEALHATRMLVAIHKSLETGAVAQV